MATPVRGIGMQPNDGMNRMKKYGKPQNVLDGQSLVMAADQDMSGWGTSMSNGVTSKRPYLDTSRMRSTPPIV